jgi:hypothetical protein
MLTRLTILYRRLFGAGSFDSPLERDFSQIEVMDLALREPGDDSGLDDQTWHDLELADLFARLDNATTPLGQQLLYHRLRSQRGCPPGELQRYRALAGDEDRACRIRRALSPMRHSSMYHLFPWVRTFRAARLPNAYLLGLLAVAPFVLGAFIPAYPVLIAPTLLFLGINFAISRAMSPRIDGDLRYLMTLNLLLACSRSLRDTGIDCTSPGGACDKPRARRYRADWRVSLLVSEPTIGVGTFVEYVIEYLNVFSLFELIAYQGFARRVDDYRRDYLDLITRVAEVDLRLGVSRYVSRYESVVEPAFGRPDELSVVGLYHPLIAHPVENDFSSMRNLVIVSGANMSGKSTFMKAMAICVVFARGLGFCHARQAVLPDACARTSLSLRDTVSGGSSYFQMEIARLKEFLDEMDANRPCLYFVDEPFKGTNRPEKLAALIAIGKFVGKRAFFFFSTHDTELCAELPGSETVHFTSTQDEAGRLRYDYKLSRGVSQDHYAISLMEQSGYNPIIVADARRRLNELRAGPSLEVVEHQARQSGLNR